MEKKVQCFYACPECGALMPYLQRRCDCGYRFHRRWPKDRRLVAAVVALSVALVAAVGVIVYQQETMAVKDSSVATPAPQPIPAAVDVSPVSPRPSYITSNGQIIVGPTEEGVAPLTIKTSGSDLYYVALARILPGLNGGAPVTSSKTFMSFIVHGGQSAEVLVPLGEYRVYYATGSAWYGREALFGEDTVRYLCDDIFLFSADADGYAGWSVTLYPVLNGNMDTQQISAAQFPE